MKSQAVEEEDKEYSITMWISAAELAFHSHRSEAVIDSWIKVQSRMLRGVEIRPVQRQLLRELLVEFASSSHWDKLQGGRVAGHCKVLESDMESLAKSSTDKIRVARKHG